VTSDEELIANDEYVANGPIPPSKKTTNLK
jgi:hypothetical protein